MSSQEIVKSSSPLYISSTSNIQSTPKMPSESDENKKSWWINFFSKKTESAQMPMAGTSKESKAGSRRWSLVDTKEMQQLHQKFEAHNQKNEQPKHSTLKADFREWIIRQKQQKGNVEDNKSSLRAADAASELKTRPARSQSLVEGVSSLSPELSIQDKAKRLPLFVAYFSQNKIVNVEGIFGQGSRPKVISEIENIINSGVYSLQEFANKLLEKKQEASAHDLATVFKRFIKGCTLFTLAQQTQLIDAYSLKEESCIAQIKKIIANLDPVRKDIFQKTVKILKAVADKQEINKMPASNLAAVMAPNFFSKLESSTSSEQLLALKQKTVGLVTLIIKHHLV